MNITPINNVNQNINFKGLKINAYNPPGMAERHLLELLQPKFPEGTQMMINCTHGGKASAVTIEGMSQGAESLIKRALQAAGFSVEETPFEMTPFKTRFQAGMDILKSTLPE